MLLIDGPRRAGYGLVCAFVGWLRRDRWFTTDPAVADSSPSQYSEVGPGRYATSILGVVNGVLPRIGIVLVAHYDEDSKTPAAPYLSLRRKWW